MCCLPLSVANSPSFSAFNPASSYKVHIIGEDRHDEGPIDMPLVKIGMMRGPIDMPLAKIGMMRGPIVMSLCKRCMMREGAGCILMQRKQKERNSSIPVISIQLFCTPTQQTIKIRNGKNCHLSDIHTPLRQ